MSHLSNLPSVEKILQTEEAAALTESFGRPLTVRAIRETLDAVRGRLKAQREVEAPPMDSILGTTASLLREWTHAGLRPVINATGVILHTNLGRAPLSRATINAMSEIARGYSNLELDLATGKRGARSLDTEAALRKLTGAEAALVVNNNAAAVLLILSALASRKQVVIARSQLVEIGGGFRMPDVMRQSGAKLVEVGTTNKVRLSDYEEAFAMTAMVLRAHRSNFKMVGFTEEPELKSIAQAAHHADQIVVDDLGSGALLDTAKYGMVHEPLVQESLAADADVVCFSGDKLLGGPQAGLIVGKAELIARINKHPLARAVRADKVTLAGIAATLMHYLRNEAEVEIPVWRMLAMPLEDVKRRAHEWAATLGTGEVRPSESTLGGGSLPGESLPTHVLSLTTARPDDLLSKLRDQDPPVIARAEKGCVLLDPRTVQTEAEHLLISGLRAVLAERR
ncbi:MAG: L-seryl-tRNA(Sec) selenium transferase [Chloroflexota bacterium]